MTEQPAGSDLYHRALAFNGDPERGALMQKVWQGTPWMVDAYTGSRDTGRHHKIMTWCREQFGPEAWPLHGHPGEWHASSVTIHGWTWMGFATQAQLRLFRERLRRARCALTAPAPRPARHPGPA